MTQPNFPDRGDNYSLEQRSIDRTDFEIEPQSESAPVARQFAVVLFITAVLASSGFIIYLFDLPGATPLKPSTPKTIPTSFTKFQSAQQSTSVRVVEG
jgi:hypothetical protein